MSNGIAISKNDILARDYWHKGTASSGYSFKGKVLHTLLINFLKQGEPGYSNWGKGLFDKYSSGYTLAVPEQLVWWKNE